MMIRREFLKLALIVTGGWMFSGPNRAPGASFPHFFFTQLKYKGESWDPNPLFVEALAEEIELRTSIDMKKERSIMTVSDPGLFFCPFVYLAGRYEFEPFTQQERQILRRFFTNGGFLFAEDTLGARSGGFDRSLRRELEQILPNYALKRLPPDHSVFQSFYLIGSQGNLGGRQKINPFLEGVTIDNWTPVIYSQNDLAGAWSRDKYGKWLYECVPGGELQRKSAFQLGINIVVYSLTSDYKKDLVHHPFIKRRRNP